MSVCIKDNIRNMNPVIGCTNVGESEEMEEVRTEDILIRDVETKNIMTKSTAMLPS